MKNNELKYSSLTYNDIVSQINELFLNLQDENTGHKFDTFRESSIAQTLIEIFAATADINNYYIQRRSEECFMDTAKLKSSVISLSRMFGYVMNRREPSRASLSLTISGDIDDNQIQIPYFSKFSYGGSSYILKESFTYRLNDTEISNITNNIPCTITLDSFNTPLDIVQGTIKEKIILGSTNTQINAPFQIYKIDDNTFSNVYGDKDYFYNGVTRVYVGESKIDKTEGDDVSTQFDIDRRSLLNWESIVNTSLDESQKVCLIRTATDGSVELLFGDGDIKTNIDDYTARKNQGYARKGAITTKDNIFIQYLSCDGASTNKSGVIGDRVTYSGKIYNSKGYDITKHITFALTSNIYGGADDESIDSIKYGTPKIYYSLDRLVSKQDYIAYLKTLTTPINVKNAIAWGEQEECERSGKFAEVKMFNVILFTLLGSLYNLTDETHTALTTDLYDSVVLDNNYDHNRLQTQGYMNVFILQEMVRQINRYYIVREYQTIIGREFTGNMDTICDDIKDDISDRIYGNSAKIRFLYGSNDYNKSANLFTNGEVTITIPGMTDTTDGKSYVDNICSLIKTELLMVKDYRGNSNENSNFGKSLFVNDEDITVEFVISTDHSDAYIFKISSSSESPCYIAEILDIDNNTLSGILQINGVRSSVTTINQVSQEINGKISQLVKDLSQRAQVQCKHVYTSPIIHRIFVEGTVYVKSMYDLGNVRKTICNDIYSWLDINADFNSPLYLSNIVEIIENHNGVVNCDIKLVPMSKRTYNGDVYDYSVNNPIYSKYIPDGGEIENRYSIDYNVNKKLQEYLNISYGGSKMISYINKLVSSNTYHLSRKSEINERSFYDSFVNPLYSYFRTLSNTNEFVDGINEDYVYFDESTNKYYPNIARFIGLGSSEDNDVSITADIAMNTDFMMIVEQIYKLLLPIMEQNLINNNGNISNEYDSTGKFIAGYTLGSEIVQIILEPNTNTNLRFVYR